MVQRYAILLLCLILFMMLSLNSQAQVQPSAETNSISVNLTRQFLKTQKDLRDKLVRYTRQFKKNPDLKIPTILLLVAILYGTIHALGPGHGKLILGAYLLTEDRIRLRKSIFVSVIAPTPSATCRIFSMIRPLTVESSVRSVPQSSTLPGITFGFSPPHILPIVSTTASCVSVVRGTCW